MYFNAPGGKLDHVYIVCYAGTTFAIVSYGGKISVNYIVSRIIHARPRQTRKARYLRIERYFCKFMWL